MLSLVFQRLFCGDKRSSLFSCERQVRSFLAVKDLHRFLEAFRLPMMSFSGLVDASHHWHRLLPHASLFAVFLQIMTLDVRLKSGLIMALSSEFSRFEANVTFASASVPTKTTKWALILHVSWSKPIFEIKYLNFRRFLPKHWRTSQSNRPTLITAHVD